MGGEGVSIGEKCGIKFKVTGDRARKRSAAPCPSGPASWTADRARTLDKPQFGVPSRGSVSESGDGLPGSGLSSLGGHWSGPSRRSAPVSQPEAPGRRAARPR